MDKKQNAFWKKNRKWIYGGIYIICFSLIYQQIILANITDFCQDHGTSIIPQFFGIIVYFFVITMVGLLLLPIIAGKKIVLFMLIITLPFCVYHANKLFFFYTTSGQNAYNRLIYEKKLAEGDFGDPMQYDNLFPPLQTPDWQRK